MTNELYDELMRSENNVTQINVTPEFADELVAKFYADGKCLPQDYTADGIRAEFLGIPVVIDDTLDTVPYKLLSERDLCCGNPDIVNQTSTVVKPWCSYRQYEVKCRNCGKVFFEEREKM